MEGSEKVVKTAESVGSGRHLVDSLSTKLVAGIWRSIGGSRLRPVNFSKDSNRVLLMTTRHASRVQKESVQKEESRESICHHYRIPQIDPRTPQGGSCSTTGLRRRGRLEKRIITNSSRSFSGRLRSWYAVDVILFKRWQYLSRSTSAIYSPTSSLTQKEGDLRLQQLPRRLVGAVHLPLSEK